MSRRVRRDDLAPFAGSRSRELRLGLLVLAVIAVVGWLSTVAINGLPFTSPYTVRVALPANGPIVSRGDDVRVGGRRVGTVRAVDLGPGGRGAVAKLELDEGKAGPGASAAVRLRGLAGAVYVELAPGDTSRPWASGTLVRKARGATQLTDVVASFDADARAALARTASGYGTGLAGRGLGLNRTLETLPDALEGITGPLRALTPPRPGAAPGSDAAGAADATGGLLTEAVDAAGDLSDQLAPPGSTQLRDVLPPSRATLTTLAANARPLDATLRAVPGVEAEAARTLPVADELLGGLRRTARELAPGITALDRALPSLRTVERRRAGLDSLSTLATQARPVVDRALPLVKQLAPVAGSIGAATAPLANASRYLAPYKEDLFEAPAGFTRWGDFKFSEGQASGARAVRFSLVLTCSLRANPYPAPSAAAKDRKPCG